MPVAWPEKKVIGIQPSIQLFMLAIVLWFVAHWWEIVNKTIKSVNSQFNHDKEKLVSFGSSKLIFLHHQQFSYTQNGKQISDVIFALRNVFLARIRFLHWQIRPFIKVLPSSAKYSVLFRSFSLKSWGAKKCIKYVCARDKNKTRAIEGLV